MAIAHVANGAFKENSGSGDTLATYTPASANNFLVVVICINNATDASVASVTDAESTWTKRSTGWASGSYESGVNRVEVFTAPCTTANSRAIGMSCNAGSFFRWGVVEFSGLGATPTFQSGSDALAESATDASVTGVTASGDADNVCIGGLAIYEDANANITVPPTGYIEISTEQNASQNMGQQVSYKINTTAQTESIAWEHDSCAGTDDGWTAGLLVIGDGDADGGGGSYFGTRRNAMNDLKGGMQ